MPRMDEDELLATTDELVDEAELLATVEFVQGDWLEIPIAKTDEVVMVGFCAVVVKLYPSDEDESVEDCRLPVTGRGAAIGSEAVALPATADELAENAGLLATVVFSKGA